jgi:hypothetical protein
MATLATATAARLRRMKRSTRYAVVSARARIGKCSRWRRRSSPSAAADTYRRSGSLRIAISTMLSMSPASALQLEVGLRRLHARPHRRGLEDGPLDLHRRRRRNGVRARPAHQFVQDDAERIYGDFGSGDIAVVNGIVKNFMNGIALLSSGDRVERVRVSDVTNIGISVVDDALISGCTVRNAYTGIVIGTGLVTGSVVTGASHKGLLFLGAGGYSANVFRGNTGGDIQGGVSLGQSLCGNGLCP